MKRDPRNHERMMDGAREYSDYMRRLGETATAEQIALKCDDLGKRFGFDYSGPYYSVRCKPRRGRGQATQVKFIREW